MFYNVKLLLREISKKEAFIRFLEGKVTQLTEN